MNTLAIVQARMGSRRLPGKVLLDLGGRTVLARVVGRLKKSREIDKMVVATTRQPADDVIVEVCESLQVSCFRGAEHDVLDRYYQAAHSYSANTVVRVTADCPLIGTKMVDETNSVLGEERA